MARGAWTLLLTAALIAWACADASAATLAQIGTFSAPTYVASPPGDPRLFVVEQGGTVRVIRDGAVKPAPFLDVTGRITSGGERGLLSIAFPPDYASSGLFYAYMTDANGNLEVDELRRSANDPDVADANFRRVVLAVPHPTNANHNGGQLQFGPDGLLYAGTGDGGGANDVDGNAQNPNVRLGKMLRLDPRQNNPQPEQVSLGLRNPWRFSFDRQTGDLVIGDVGQRRVEEIDFAPAPGVGQGFNYGWNRFEGNEDFSTGQPATNPPPEFTFPVITHTHADGWCSITGGYVVRDPALPELGGRYVYGDFCKGDIHAATLPNARDDAPTGMHVEMLSSFGEDASGRIYATSLNGPVYRLESGGGAAPPPGQGNGGGPPGTTAVADTAAPTVGLSAARRHRLLRTGRIRFAARCDEQCTITASARAVDRRTARLRRTLAAGSRVVLELRLTTALRRALRRSLRRHPSVALVIDVRAVDAAGNARLRQLRLRAAS